MQSLPRTCSPAVSSSLGCCCSWASHAEPCDRASPTRLRAASLLGAGILIGVSPSAILIDLNGRTRAVCCFCRLLRTINSASRSSLERLAAVLPERPQRGKTQCAQARATLNFLPSATGTYAHRQARRTPRCSRQMQCESGAASERAWPPSPTKGRV
ncbi:hypothetical protein FA09DRAFT_250075 [Tilletiopsis washingtonensis]|uniref:Uncharacterized protein n=1 Tax=Tilletiopsis washingtonensis TaxID=58919 RepID=A0A316ZCT4_9BASI|nr:hypothetical protein FA09DRAFT_250075 [Tilletiopsis washingtonensis]PWN98742.1 hypothetical protein FA09DRAFT_250075 [Tilletiopsis washingtonensis]